MITRYGGYDSFDIMYDKGGDLVDAEVEAECIAYFGAGEGKAVTDLIVISHGWNNDIAEARSLYSKFFDAFASVARVTSPIRTFGVAALFWPSKRFAEASLVPGGAAEVADPLMSRVFAQLQIFSDVFSDDPTAAEKLAYLRSLVPKLKDSPAAQDGYVSTLVSLVPTTRYEIDEGMEGARHVLDTMPGRIVLSRLAKPIAPMSVPVGKKEGATGLASPGGQAAGIGSILGGITSAAASLGDALTYYTMKDRAGAIGRTGTVNTIRKFRRARPNDPPLRVHLVGHSFGGRLVTAAANALNGGSGFETVDSMTLLEAAYSHNGLAANWDGKGANGSFRSIMTSNKVTGPIIISHSCHDWPVGIAYPIASRLMNQVAEEFGGPNDIYGGMGRNGAQHTPDVTKVILASTFAKGSYPKAPGKTTWILNVCGDGPPPAPTITSHGDVAKPELAFVMLNYI